GEKARKSVRSQPARVDTLDAELLQFRTAQDINVYGRRRLLRGIIETRFVPDPENRIYGVFAGSGTQQEAIAKRDFFTDQHWAASDGRPLIGVVRPPWPPSDRWTAVVGIRDAQRVRILFSQDEATRLLADLNRRVPAGHLGPLASEEFLMFRIRTHP